MLNKLIMKKILFPVFLALAFWSQLVTATDNPNYAAAGTFPACSSGTVVPLRIPDPNHFGQYLSWQFLTCYTGAKSLEMGVRKVRLIDTAGNAVTVYNDTRVSITPVDLIANPFNILQNADTKSLFSSNFQLDTIELTFDNVIHANAVARFTDDHGTQRVCGTTSSAFNYSWGANTQASPLTNDGGTMNGRPMILYQKNDPYSTTVQGPEWLEIVSLPFAPSGFTVDSNAFYKYGGTTYTSAYANSISSILDATVSPSIQKVSLSVVDENFALAGYDNSVLTNNGYTGKYLVNTLKLRNPIVLSNTSKFNFDLKLDLSKMFGWAMYYDTGSATPPANPTHDHDCQQLIMGPILLNVTKTKLAKKDD